MAFFKKKRVKQPAAAGQPPPVSPVVTLIAADLALRLGNRLLRGGVERGLLKGRKAPTGQMIPGADFRSTIIGTVAVAVARRSVPGAILVGGGLLAKALRDRRKARLAQAKAGITDKNGDNST